MHNFHFAIRATARLTLSRVTRLLVECDAWLWLWLSHYSARVHINISVVKHQLTNYATQKRCLVSTLKKG